MKQTIIAVDLAKSVFEVAVSEKAGRIAERHRFSRTRFSSFMADQKPATVLLEACGSAPYWDAQWRNIDTEQYCYLRILHDPMYTGTKLTERM